MVRILFFNFYLQGLNSTNYQSAWKIHWSIQCDFRAYWLFKSSFLLWLRIWKYDEPRPIQLHCKQIISMGSNNEPKTKIQRTLWSSPCRNSHLEKLSKIQSLFCLCAIEISHGKSDYYSEKISTLLTQEIDSYESQRALKRGNAKMERNARRIQSKMGWHQKIKTCWDSHQLFLSFRITKTNNRKT